MPSSLASQVPGFLAPLASVLTLMAGCGGASEAGRAPAAPATGEPTTVAVPTPSAQANAEPTSRPTPAPPDFSRKLPLVSAGHWHTCALREDGTATCWGGLDPGLGQPPEGEFAAISAGRHHSCGLRPSGKVECWGGNGEDWVHPPEGEYTLVQAGRSKVSCAVEKHSKLLRCWGKADYTNEVPKRPAVSIALGAVYGCIVHGPNPKIGGWVRCNRREYLPKPYSREFTAVYQGWSGICGLAVDGQAVCWDWGAKPILEPPPNLRFRQITGPGYAHACGLKHDGSVVCWGSTKGKPKDGNRCADIDCGQAAPPERLRFTQISGGFMHTCGVTVDAKIACWGAGADRSVESSYDEGQSDVPADLR